jgi:hypothetical protein
MRYDRRWRKQRAWYLSAHPLCERCRAAGKTKVAEVAHHLQYEPPVLEALCRFCHEKEHGRINDMPKGSDVNGLPTDPNHPWNGGGA